MVCDWRLSWRSWDIVVMILVKRIIDGAATKGEPSEGEDFLQTFPTSSPVMNTCSSYNRKVFVVVGCCEKNSGYLRREWQILACHSSWKLKLSGISASISPCKANSLLLPYGPHDSYCSSSLGAKNKLSVKTGSLKISVAGEFYQIFWLPYKKRHDGLIIFLVGRGRQKEPR